jgi:HEAT repeat protein
MNDGNAMPLQEQVTRLLKIIGSIEYSPKERDLALEHLLELNKEKTQLVLLSILSDRNYPDPEVRYRAANAMASIDPYSCPKLLLPFLNDPDYHIRMEVCGRIYNYGYIYHENFDEAILPLTGILRHDAEVSVRLIAAHALRVLGDKRAIPALQWAQEHDDGEDWEGRSVRDAAVEAMEEILGRNPDINNNAS